MAAPKRILVSPLDWGLGHAQRCIPIVRSLLAKNNEVIIGAEGRGRALLQKEFPALKFINLPGYQVRYAKKGMALKMLLSIPAILKGIQQEHEALEQLVEEEQIDLVISDNRYGLWSHKVPCVFITHQIFIQSPIFQGWLNKINHRYINKFNYCWIPDMEGEPNLSGSLSHGNIPKNCQYIGPLSPFQKEAANTEHDLLVLLSGPEPQRSIFQEKVLQQLVQLPLNSIVVGGKTESDQTKKINEQILYYDHLSGKALQEVIQNAKMVLARSGYSSIMDLAKLEKKALFVPTPGQTEQEYLAKHLQAPSMEQKNFDLKKLLAAENVQPLKAPENSLLEAAISSLLEGE